VTHFIHVLVKSTPSPVFEVVRLEHIPPHRRSGPV
jgi:hypothetical protein